MNKKKSPLVEKFLAPPFSVLDTKQGYWMDRKKYWKELGIKSEVGREEALCYAKNIKKIDDRKSYNGSSVFDPFLCEIMYNWFCIKGGHILDPFAGGSVRGIVAAKCGYKYTGIELRELQVNSNMEQSSDIMEWFEDKPKWICGDSNQVLNDMIDDKFDMIFSCPPYMDLEVYSDLDNDLSNMSDDEFIKIYNDIIYKTCLLLNDDSFAIFVVGDVRCIKTGFYKDFINLTKNAFYKSNLKLYNECILLENGLNTAAIRVNNYFPNRKLVKTHQNVLIFYKGDTKKIKNKFGTTINSFEITNPPT